MLSLNRRAFLKASSAVLVTTAVPLGVSSAYAENSSSITAKELPGFEGKLPAAVAISSDGKVFGLIKDDYFGIIDSEGVLLTGIDRAVRWNEDLSYGILEGPKGSTEAQMSQALGASQLGVACGVYQNKKGVLNASVWINGELDVLSGLKETERSKALACNDRNIVVGTSTENKFDVPVYWNLAQSNKAKKLLTPKGFSGSANGVSDAGLIVGQITRIDGTFGRAVIWETAQDNPIVLPVPEGVEESIAAGISSRGTIFGAVKNPQGRYQASYWDGGNFSYINGVGNTYSKFLSVNDAGIAVGTYTTANKGVRLFAYKDGRVVNLEGLGGNLMSVISVSGNGIACGMSENSDGDIRAVIWDVANV